MAVKSGSIGVQAFSLENDEEPKTYVYGKPITEGQRRQILKTKRGGEMEIIDEKLFRLALAKNDKGNYIENIWHNGTFFELVDDLNVAMDILENCRDANFMGQLKAWFIGISELDGVTVKNLASQSKPS